MSSANDYHGAGVRHNQHFQKWWSTARQSSEPPLLQDFLVNFGLHPTVVKRMLIQALELQCPPDRTTTMLCGEVNYFGGPGSIHYFASNMLPTNKDGSYDGPISEYNLVRKYLGIENVTEQDLLSLARISHPRWWENTLEKAVTRGGYSDEFLTQLFGMMPPRENDSIELCFGFYDPASLRQALDCRCISALQRALPAIRSLNLSGEWRLLAFSKFLSMLLQPTTTLEDLVLSVPKHYYFGGGQAEEEAFQPSFPPNGNDSPSIKRLMLCMTSKSHSYERHKSVPTMFGPVDSGTRSLQFVSRLSNLQDLGLDNEVLSMTFVAPCIVSILENPTTRLQDLRLRVHSQSMVHEADKNHVANIFKALKTNASVQRFCYVENFAATAKTTERLASYEKVLLEMLQAHNVTLQSVLIQSLDQAFRSSYRDKVDYYLALNANGRRFVRSPTATAADVAKLLFIEDNIDFELLTWYMDTDATFLDRFIKEPTKWRKRSNNFLFQPRLRYFNTNYGLLREMPCTWSGSVGTSSPANGRSGKRKRES